MYNWNQFRNFPKFKDMSQQEQARQYFLYQSNMMMEQSANAALAPAAAAAAAGAGGGGRLPQSTAVDYGSEGVLYTGLYNDGVSNIWKGYFLNYKEGTINEVDLEDANEWNTDYIDFTQNGGYTYGVNNNDFTRYKIKFYDVSGNLLDSIENPKTGDDRYELVDFYQTTFAIIRKLKKFIDNVCVGYIWIWFNGKDKPTIHEFNGTDSQDPKVVSTFDRADRNGNFCIERNLDGLVYEYYSMGKSLVLIDTIEANANTYGVYYYTNFASKGSFLLIKNNNNRITKLTRISGNQEIGEILEFPLDTYTYVAYIYGTTNKIAFELTNTTNSLVSFYTYVEKTNKFAVIEFDTAGLSYDVGFSAYNPHDANESGLADSCYVFTYASSMGDSRNGQIFTDFKFYYFASDDDQWRTFQKSSFYLGNNSPKTSGNGIYLDTDNDGSASAYSLYLSKGVETYSELVTWTTQSSSPIEVYRTGIDSVLYLCNSADYPGYLQAKMVTAGKSADGGDNPITFRVSGGYIKSFGVILCRADGPLLNLGIAYAWTEGTGKWHKFESPQAIYPGSEPSTSFDGMNVPYLGCKFPQASLFEDSPNGNPGGRHIIINGLSSTLSYVVGPWSYTPEKNTYGFLYGAKIVRYGYYSPNQYFAESVDVDSKESYEYLMQPVGSTWYVGEPVIIGKRGFFKYNAEDSPTTSIKLILLGSDKAVESDLINIGANFGEIRFIANDTANSF